MPKIDEDERAERRQRFIAAAWRCLAERGYRDTTVDAVCEEAEASKGAFYVYFDSKAALFAALLDDQARRLDAAAEQIGGRGFEGLHAFAHETLREAQDPARVQLRADVWAAVAGDDELRRRFAASVDRRRALLRDAVEQLAADGAISADVPANAIASILLALTDGLMLHHALNPAGFRWPKVSLALDRLLDGLAVPAETDGRRG